jgi:Ca2+-binding RTX toxin-like protein
MLGVVGIPEAPAQESDGTIVSAAAVNVATDVINGTVLAIQSVDTGSEVHSLALVRVDEAVQGDLSGDVFVEVPGGTSAGGLQVTVSHQPSFRVSDVVQLALLRSTAAEEAVLTGGASPVYSVVGGIDGAAAVSGSLLSQANASGDFTLTGTKWDPSDSSRWPIPYTINTAGSGLSGADVRSAISGAMQQWVDDSATDIAFAYDPTVTNGDPGDYNDGLNTIGWVDTDTDEQFLAQAVWVSSSGTTLAFDIRFNRDYQWAWGAQSGHFDIETVQLHEIGHVLGLGHTTASTAEVMYPSISSNTTKGLGAGDMSGVAGLYPAANPPAGGNGGGNLPDGSFSEADCAGLTFTVFLDQGQNGTNGPDVILGTPGDDLIWGRDGDDIICGLGGSDRIIGGDGDDRISGGDGRDYLDGRNGDDIVNGDRDDDWVYGGNDDDVLFGGHGDDKVVGGNGNDDHYGGSGSDRIYGRRGSDFVDGGSHADRIYGGRDDDILRGGGGDDKILGDTGDDQIRGDNGDDLLYGRKGNDILQGDAGNDRLDGDENSDVCLGGSGGKDVARECERVESIP